MSDQVRKLRTSIVNLDNAMKRLEEALEEDPSNSLIVDGTIQRFEFTIELYWKTLKRLLLIEGIETKTPRETLKEAYQAGWLNREEDWLQMLRDRNATSHTYDEAAAREIVEHIHQYFPEMKKVFTFIKEKTEHYDI